MHKVIIKNCLLSLLLAIVGCNDTPTGSVNGERFGKVFVTANIKNAEIFLDNISTNKFTPDTISALATGYNIKVRRIGYFSDKQRIIFNSKQIQTLNLTLVDSTNYLN